MKTIPIIARLKRRDGFVKEMPIDKIDDYIKLADVPPLSSSAEPDAKTSDSRNGRVFVQKRRKMVVEYEEV